MSFVRSLAGPHVLVACAVGLARGWALVPPDPRGADLLVPLLLGVTAAGAALLARRLTGNTLVSACAGALVAVHPAGALALLPLWAAACGFFAAGVRLLPAPAVAGAPLLGRREVLALALLLAGSFGGPAILAMPVLILLADLAYAPDQAAALKRTGRLFPLHAIAVCPALFRLAAIFPPPGSIDDLPFHDTARDADPGFGGQFALTFLPVDGSGRLAVVLPAVLLPLSLLVLALRSRLARTLVVAMAFAALWTAAAQLSRLVVPTGRAYAPSVLAVFGVALLIPTILWRISLALAQPRLAAGAEPPIPPVPPLADLARSLRSEPPPSAPATGQAPVSALGLRSAVETAVAGAVAGAIEQIRLALRAPKPDEPPAPPEEILWNRLLTGTSGGAGPAEPPEDALARWRGVFEKEIAPRIKDAGDVLCVGPTPWPLVSAVAGRERTVTLLERGRRPAQRAAHDLRACGNVLVVRHDRGLGPVKDLSVDAVICLFEASMQIPAQTLALLRECMRVLRPGGVAGIGFADLALSASQNALARGAPSECFVNRAAIESLARLAGFGRFEISAEILPMTSIAWLKVRPEAGVGGKGQRA